MTTAVETAIRVLGALIKEELTVMCTRFAVVFRIK